MIDVPDRERTPGRAGEHGHGDTVGAATDAEVKVSVREAATTEQLRDGHRIGGRRRAPTRSIHCDGSRISAIDGTLAGSAHALSSSSIPPCSSTDWMMFTLGVLLHLRLETGEFLEDLREPARPDGDCATPGRTVPGMG